MFEKLEEIDRNLLLSLNSHHNDFFDLIMPYLTSIAFWIPLYLFFIYMVYKKVGKKVWLVLAAVAILIVFCDQTSNLVKNSVERYRPSHNLEIKDKLHIVDGYRGGQYGFFSGHAANTFGIATFLLLFFRDKKWGFKLLIISWAIIMTYSRIYLGVHYPSDIICGATVGILLAIGVYYLYNRVVRIAPPQY
ncbi:MAG TPA: phosphatase PAP2 family protein [Nitrosopumilaceae archaeon]|jgi:undecaprenyl-diphosphatase|nr:phosphatase PAP2 family protein [Nitrosopumilaceae archaeon]